MSGMRRLNPIELALMIALTGCAGTVSPPPAQETNLGGYSAQFKQGYNDGCESARGSRQRKDETRFQKEIDYMMGWNDGYSVCSRR